MCTLSQNGYGAFCCFVGVLCRRRPPKKKAAERLVCSVAFERLCYLLGVSNLLMPLVESTFGASGRSWARVGQSMVHPMLWDM